MIFQKLLTLFFVGVASAIPASHGLQGESKDSLPLLNLPYGTWRAAEYDSASDVYTFRNIRFAAPPIGDRRWAKPASPAPVSGIQDGSYGPNCIPAPVPPEFTTPALEKLAETADEDCLFLDIYVPGKALKGKERAKLPVIVWMYGGGYVTGSKDQDLAHGMYDGTSLINRADGNAIVVTFNYRLGVFGFLAGTTMETTAVPNVGLHDQRAALQWVQDFVHLIGGDRNNVSAWGESAGAGSIIYHLVAEGGAQDPLFHRAIVMSPGFPPNIDRRGQIEDQFLDFAEIAECAGEGVACLRAANASVLNKASQKIEIAGPSPDGSFIRRTPSVELLEGHYWKHLDSLIVTHVADEGFLFVPEPVGPNYVSSYLQGLFPSYAPDAAPTIEKLYTNESSDATPAEAARTMVSDAIFTCNARRLVEAYPENSYLAQYSVTPGTHGADIAAVFYSRSLYNASIPLFSAYQSYLTSHALTGNPNTLRDREVKPPTIEWPLVDNVHGERIHNTLNVTDLGYELIGDGESLKSICDVWAEVLSDVTEKGGY